MIQTVRCPDCGKLVRDKPVLGSLHLCLTDQELAALRRRQRVHLQQLANQQPQPDAEPDRSAA
jgi:hypothetical protein